MPKQDIFNISTTNDSKIPSKQTEEEDPSKITAEKEKGFPNMLHTFNPVFTLRLQFNDLWNMVDNCAIQHGALHTRAIAVHVRSQPTANSTFAPQTMWTWGTPFAGGERMWLNIEERRGKVQRRLIVDIGS